MIQENGFITELSDSNGVDAFINMDKQNFKNIKRKYIQIEWNPTFKYGGPISVVEYFVLDNNETCIGFVSNGFWDKLSAWNFAESIREDINESIIQWW